MFKVTASQQISPPDLNPCELSMLSELKNFLKTSQFGSFEENEIRVMTVLKVPLEDDLHPYFRAKQRL
jgi:hypothetical protein